MKAIKGGFERFAAVRSTGSFAIQSQLEGHDITEKCFDTF
jgi:hypothetical protein